MADTIPTPETNTDSFIEPFFISNAAVSLYLTLLLFCQILNSSLTRTLTLSRGRALTTRVVGKLLA